MKVRFFVSSILMIFVVCTYLEAHNGSNDYRYIECTITPIIQKESQLSHPHIPGPRSLDKRALPNQVTSTNWSGYAAASNFTKPVKNSVSAVFGSWIVPKLLSTPDDSYCALWVGIDGYTSSTVEQIGTSHDWVNGAQDNYAWFEMYPGGSYSIGSFPLSPGDVISASVVYSGNSIFTMTIWNDTRQVFTTIPTSYTRSTTALRQSAEWIVEAPYYNGILPLSDFVTAYMWGCMATINGVTGPIGTGSWKNVPIQMVTNNGTPKDFISTLLPDKGSFFATWAHE